MSRRRLDIGIRTGAERSLALREAFRRVANGDRTEPASGLYFESVEDLRRILTDRRLGLLVAIGRNRPASVRELAGVVGRDYKNVNSDIVLLERLGLVKLSTRKGKGRAHAPTVPYDEIRVTIDLRRPRAVRTAFGS